MVNENGSIDRRWSVQSGVPTATPLVLLARPAGTRGVAPYFLTPADESPRFREIRTPLSEEIGVHPHDPRRRVYDKIVTLLSIDRFFEWSHFRVRVVLVSKGHDRHERAAMLFVIDQL